MNAIAVKQTKRDKFASILEKAVNACPKTQLEIANDIGYPNQNFITMLKRGTSRLPMNKIVPMAQSLELDPAFLMREWFQAYMPEMLEDLEKTMGGMTLTSNERSWVKMLRKAFNNSVPAADSRVADDLVKNYRAVTA